MIDRIAIICSLFDDFLGYYKSNWRDINKLQLITYTNIKNIINEYKDTNFIFTDRNQLVDLFNYWNNLSESDKNRCHFTLSNNNDIINRLKLAELDNIGNKVERGISKDTWENFKNGKIIIKDNYKTYTDKNINFDNSKTYLIQDKYSMENYTFWKVCCVIKDNELKVLIPFTSQSTTLNYLQPIWQDIRLSPEYFSEQQSISQKVISFFNITRGIITIDLAINRNNNKDIRVLSINPCWSYLLSFAEKLFCNYYPNLSNQWLLYFAVGLNNNNLPDMNESKSRCSDIYKLISRYEN